MAETKQESRAVAKKEWPVVEFVPFGAKDKITLTIEVVKQIIAVPTKTGKLCSDKEAFKFILMCQARKLNPFEGDAFLIGYDNKEQPDKPNFSLITSHQAFLKRAELHPEYDGMESGTIVLRNAKIEDLIGDWHMPNDNILGAWAKVFFKNRSHPTHKRVRLVRFKKPYGIWNDDPAGMIVKCAESDALRSSFPTMLGGMFIREEMDVQTEQGEPQIAHAHFVDDTPPTTGDGATTAALTERTAENAALTELQRPADEQKAAAAPTTTTAAPTLKRRSRSAAPEQQPTANTATATEKALTDRAKMKAMLTVGGFTTADFVAVAVDEGWVEVEDGGWDKIPDDRFTEFLKAENWALVMELLEARREVSPAPKTEPAAPAAPAKTTRTSKARPGELL